MYYIFLDSSSVVLFIFQKHGLEEYAAQKRRERRAEKQRRNEAKPRIEGQAPDKGHGGASQDVAEGELQGIEMQCPEAH